MSELAKSVEQWKERVRIECAHLAASLDTRDHKLVGLLRMIYKEEQLADIRRIQSRLLTRTPSHANERHGL